MLQTAVNLTNNTSDLMLFLMLSFQIITKIRITDIKINN